MSLVEVVDLRWRRGCCGELAVSRFQHIRLLFRGTCWRLGKDLSDLHPSIPIPTARLSNTPHSTFNSEFRRFLFCDCIPRGAANTYWISDVLVCFGEHYTLLVRTRSYSAHSRCSNQPACAANVGQAQLTELYHNHVHFRETQANET
jgi:hypothetical protein